MQLLEYKTEQASAHGENAGGSSSDNFVVRSFELLGFDVIWRVALETQRPQVVKRSIAFLNSLHEKLSPDLKVRCLCGELSFLLIP